MNPNEEFEVPDVNYDVLMTELRQRLEQLQFDLLHIQDEEVKGFAREKYTHLKIKYFMLMKEAIVLSSIFPEDEKEEEDL